VGSAGLAISGDVFGSLPSGISPSGTGYQWAYSATSATGPWIDISGATSATYTPSATNPPFNNSGTYYLIRKAVLSSTNNISPTPYIATNESNAATIIVNALPSASISYSGTPYCAIGAAIVSQTGTTGGTYSSTAGMIINPSTGAINLSESTPGTYIISYNFSNGTCSNVTSTSVTINPLPTATISYSGTPYCATGTVTVSQTGQAGGTFSSAAGLSMNSITGEINLSASASGSYTVTYNFSNGTCSNSTSTGVTIFALPVPTFIESPGTEACAFDEVAYTTQSGMSNYNWTIPGALGADYTITSGGTGPTDHTVALKWITDTDKTVTVNYTDGNGCTGSPATSTITVHPIPEIGSFN
jgi:hypothetical protein